MILCYLGCGFRYFLCSSPIGEDFQFDSYFSDGVGSTTNQLCFPVFFSMRLSPVAIETNNSDVSRVFQGHMWL